MHRKCAVIFLCCCLASEVVGLKIHGSSKLSSSSPNTPNLRVYSSNNAFAQISKNSKGSVTVNVLQQQSDGSYKPIRALEESEMLDLICSPAIISQVTRCTDTTDLSSGKSFLQVSTVPAPITTSVVAGNQAGTTLTGTSVASPSGTGAVASSPLQPSSISDSAEGQPSTPASVSRPSPLPVSSPAPLPSGGVTSSATLTQTTLSTRAVRSTVSSVGYMPATATATTVSDGAPPQPVLSQASAPTATANTASTTPSTGSAPETNIYPIGTSFANAFLAGRVCPLPSPFMRIDTQTGGCCVDSISNVWPNFCPNADTVVGTNPNPQLWISEHTTVSTVPQNSKGIAIRHLPAGVYVVSEPDILARHNMFRVSRWQIAVGFVASMFILAAYVFVYAKLEEDQAIWEGKAREHLYNLDTSGYYLPESPQSGPDSYIAPSAGMGGDMPSMTEIIPAGERFAHDEDERDVSDIAVGSFADVSRPVNIQEQMRSQMAFGLLAPVSARGRPGSSLNTPRRTVTQEAPVVVAPPPVVPEAPRSPSQVYSDLVNDEKPV